MNDTTRSEGIRPEDRAPAGGGGAVRAAADRPDACEGAANQPAAGGGAANQPAAGAPVSRQQTGAAAWQQKAEAETLRKYGDIIDLPHPDSKAHPRMTNENRAAQFAPFQALSGFGDAIKERADEVEESFGDR